MPYVSHAASADPATAGVNRAIVKALFVASILLSVVSWYTTQQGMALYLSPWFALLASAGIQSALVLTAWLIGFSGHRRALLIAVYAITAVVSIAFSYVSLYTWFSARERPAAIERRLYDALSEQAAKLEPLLSSAASEAQKHSLALEEMTAAEKISGHISRAKDSDPFLNRIREAVAEEARTYNAAYREGGGEGVRYTAFDRHSKLARQSLERIEQAQQRLAAWRAARKPQDATEKQLRDYEQTYATVPWSDIEQALHQPTLERPAAPAYSQFVDQASSSQEELLLAFQDLAANAGGRPLFSFALAAFIDVIIFLLAYAAGPHFSSSPEQRWLGAAAALEGMDSQLMVRNFVRKVESSPRGEARVEIAALTPGERQLCLAFASRGQAAIVEEDGNRYYLLDENVHHLLLDILARPGFPMRAASSARATEPAAG